jgi:hypothetical protein
MALFYECMLKCAQKLLDTADIVRDAMLRQLRRRAVKLCTVADVLNQEFMQDPVQPGVYWSPFVGFSRRFSVNTVARDPDRKVLCRSWFHGSRFHESRTRLPVLRISLARP